MLKQLRSQKTMKRVLRITLILIIPSFIAFYGWSQLSGGNGRGGDSYEFAKIKPKDRLLFWKWDSISKEDMKVADEQVQQEYSQILGPQARNMNLNLKGAVTPKQRINRALDNYILNDYAGIMNIAGSDEEVGQSIAQMFSYQNQNPRDIFKVYLQRANMTEEYYFYSQKNELKLSKAKLQLQSRAKVSLFECWLSYLALKENLKVAYTLLPVKNFSEKVNVDENELKKYFEENIKKFTVPEKVNYEYIVFSLKEMADTIQVTDEDVTAYYNENKETEFKEPKKVEGRHIYLEVKQPTPEKELEVKNKIDKIYKDVKAGKDFAALADEFSEDPKNIAPEKEEEAKQEDKKEEKKVKKLGGKFSPIAENKPSVFGEDFVTSVTQLKAGAITEPMRSAKGWHIVKVEEVIPESYKNIEDQKEGITQTIKNKKGAELLTKKEEEVGGIIKNFSTLSSLAKELSRDLKETGLIESSLTFLPDIQNIAENKTYIDDLTKNEMSQVLKNNNAVYVLSKKDIVKTHDPTLEEVKEEVVNAFKLKKSIELAQSYAEEKSKEIKTADDLKKFADENKIEFKITEEYFTRLQPPKEFPAIKNFERATLNTPKDKINVSPVDANSEGVVQGYAVWMMTDKQEPSQEEFVKELPKIQEELLSMKRETIYREFLNSQESKFESKINPDYIAEKN